MREQGRAERVPKAHSKNFDFVRAAKGAEKASCGETVVQKGVFE